MDAARLASGRHSLARGCSIPGAGEAFGRIAQYLDEDEDPLPLPDDLTTAEGAARALLGAGRALDVAAGFLVDADPAHAAEVGADLDEQLARVQAARTALRALRGW
jgi:hypothetical protein